MKVEKQVVQKKLYRKLLEITKADNMPGLHCIKQLLYGVIII
jgi:hypothetical protein